MPPILKREDLTRERTYEYATELERLVHEEELAKEGFFRVPGKFLPLFQRKVTVGVYRKTEEYYDGDVPEKIKFPAGSKLEHVVNELLKYREAGKLVFCKFNGVILNSHTVTMDDAFLEVTGLSKEQFDEVANAIK